MPATISVRQWFRAMRAADFERDRTFAAGGPRAIGEGLFWSWTPPDLRPWTLLDTQQIVARETADHYWKIPDDYVTWGGLKMPQEDAEAIDHLIDGRRLDEAVKSLAWHRLRQPARDETDDSRDVAAWNPWRQYLARETPAHVRLAPWLQHAPHCARETAETCDCGLNDILRELREATPAAPR